MKTITHNFPSLALAEAFQFALYARYESVRLLRSPLFEEAGVYAWEVADPLDPTEPSQ